MVRNNYPMQGAYYPMQNSQMVCAYVQGEPAAKAYPIAPGQFAVLLDSESNTLYTKTTDQFGRPLPIRIFDYTERIDNSNEQSNNYVTKSDFESFKNEIKELLRPKQNNYKNQSAKEDKQ